VTPRTGLGRLLPALLLPLVIVAMTRVAAAAPLSSLEGLELLRRGFAGVTDFTAEITQEKQLSLMKKKLTATGVIRFRKPDTFYMEIFSPYTSRLLLKNTDLVIFYPREGTRQTIALPPEEGLGKWFTYLDRPVTTLPDGVDVRAERRGGTCILQFAPQGKGGVKALGLTFLEDGSIRQIVITEQNGDRATITFRNMKKNVGLKDRDFRLE